MKCLSCVALLLLAACTTPEPPVQKTTRAIAELKSCGSTDLIEGNLLKHYKEDRSALGLMQDGNTLVSLYQSTGGKTWTIVLTTPNHVSCLYLAGNHWHDPAPRKR